MLSDPLTIVGVFMLGASAGALLTFVRDRIKFLEVGKAHCQEPQSTRNTAVESKAHLGMKALVVGRDPEMISIFSHVLRDRGIEIQKCFSESAALEQLSSAKFQAMIVDSDEMDSAKLLKNVPRPNERVLVIAVGSDSKKQAATLAGIAFAERPLAPQQVRELLRVAYGRMLRDGQQYFRLTAELPVSIRNASGVVLQCMTLNVSQTGMALKSDSSFKAGDPVNIAFAVPNTDILVTAEGKVIWDDKHGKTGISFQCDSSSAQSRYHEWLHDHFFMMQSDVSSLQESEQKQEPYVDQPFIRKIFKVPDLAYLHNRRDRLRRSGTVRDTEESDSLLGSSGRRHDGRTYRSGSDHPRSFN